MLVDALNRWHLEEHNMLKFRDTTPPLCLILSIYIFYMNPASAAYIEVLNEKDRYGFRVILSGIIEEGDSVNLQEIQLNLPRTTEAENIDGHLCLNSPGGSLQEAVNVYDILAMTTSVPQNFICESACSIIFMGGKASTYEAGDNEAIASRAIWPGGRLGVHAPELRLNIGRDTFSASEISKSYDLAIETLATLATKNVFSDRIFTSLVTTPHSDMHYLNVGDIISSGIGLVDPALPNGRLIESLYNVCNNTTYFKTSLSTRSQGISEITKFLKTYPGPEVQGDDAYSIKIDMSGYEGLLNCEIKLIIPTRFVNNFHIDEVSIFFDDYPEISLVSTHRRVD